MTANVEHQSFTATDLDDITGIPHPGVFGPLIRDTVARATNGTTWLIEFALDETAPYPSAGSVDLYRLAAGMLADAARRTDSVGHTGVGRVGLLLTDTALDDAESISGRLRRRLDQQAWCRDRVTVRVRAASSVVSDRPG